MKDHKILQIITGLRPGGAERLLLDLCTNLKTNGIKTLVYSVSPLNQLYKNFIENGIETNIVVKKRTLFSFFQGISMIYKRIKKDEIEIAHAHMFHSLVAALIIKIFYPKIKIVFTPHSTNYSGNAADKQGLNSIMRMNFMRITKSLRSADIIFDTTMRSNFLKDNAFVIPNGIDTSKFMKPISKNKIFTFICVGRIDYVKNHQVLIPIVKELIKEGYEFQIHLVGHGILYEELKVKIKTNGLTEKIHMLGFHENIVDYLLESHVFLLPSLWEGMPLSILEAGASRLPIITTPVGVIPSIISTNEGYVVPLDNFKETMKHTMDNYSEALLKASSFQKKVINSYDIEVTTRSHQRLYASLIER